MKIKKRLFVLSFLAVLFCFICPVSAKEAFVINNMDIKLDISENGLIHVEQVVDLTFSEARHGLYFNIPTKYQMNWEIDGAKVNKNYHFPASKIKVDGFPYSIDSQSNGIQVKIGDQDKLINGKQTFNISYDIKTSDLRIGGRQMLYQNLIDGWDTEVLNANMIINMPKSFDLGSLYFYIGENSANQTYDGFSYKIENNTVIASLTNALPANNAITIQIDLPNNYFNFPKPFDWTWIIIIGSGLLALLAVVIYFLYGKDGLVIKPVMFKAPDGLTCAAVSYIADGQVKHQDVICLLIEWANLGYLEIEEVDSKEIKLTKLMDMKNERTKYERRLFSALFKSSDAVLTSELDENFYININKTTNEVKHYFKNSKERRIFSKNSLIFQTFAIILAVIPILCGVLQSAYSITFELSYSILICTFICLLFLSIEAFWFFIVVNRIVYKKSKLILLSIIASILSAFLAIIYFLLVDKSEVNNLVYYTTILSTMIICVVAVFMDKRTEIGMKWYGEILGLKDFIETAEKDRLEMLVEENPQYFYNILPYAYVLGISDVWSKKFADIVMENALWYRSDEHVPVYLFMPRFYRSMSTLQSSLYHIPEITTSTGGGSFGGGSGGGGGFSGGGFGGGGGGSW